jgi:hypothetical protein
MLFQVEVGIIRQLVDARGKDKALKGLRPIFFGPRTLVRAVGTARGLRGHFPLFPGKAFLKEGHGFNAGRLQLYFRQSVLAGLKPAAPGLPGLHKVHLEYKERS